MSDNIAIRSSGAVPFAATNSAAATKSSAASAGSVGTGTTATATAGSTSASTTYTNPSVQIDGRLGLVVIAFHDQAGHVVDSIPTQKQLQAYRDGSAPLPKTDGDPAATAASTSARASPSSAEATATITAAGTGVSSTAAVATHGG